MPSPVRVAINAATVPAAWTELILLAPELSSYGTAKAQLALITDLLLYMTLPTTCVTWLRERALVLKAKVDGA